jgi:hypothetical protein
MFLNFDFAVNLAYGNWLKGNFYPALSFLVCIIFVVTYFLDYRFRKSVMLSRTMGFADISVIR